METRFQEYINYVCGGIRSRHMREQVADELLSHLEERYEQNRAVGLDSDSAEADAIAHMGKRDVLRKTFRELYPIETADYTRTAMRILSIGLLCTHMHLNLFVGCAQITTLLGELLLLLALFKLYTADRRIKNALILYPLSLLSTMAAAFTSYYCIPTPGIVIQTLEITSAAFSIFTYGLLFAGLHRIGKSLRTQSEKDPHLPFCCTLLIGIRLFFISIIFLTEDGSGEIQLGIFGYLPLLVLLIILLGLRRARLILCHTEPAWELKKTWQTRGKVCYALLAVLMLLLPIGSMHAAALRQPKTTVYVQNDTTLPASEVAAARENLLQLGFPEIYLQDLPDSEIINYRNATYMTIPRGEEVLARYAETNPTNTMVRTYAFFIPGADTQQVHTDAVRLLYVLDNFDAQSFHGRDGFYCQFDRKAFYVHRGTENAADTQSAFFSLILADKNGQTLSAEPLYTVPMHNAYGGYKTYSGAEFAFPKKAENRRAYFAAEAQFFGGDAFGIASASGYVSAVTYHKSMPIYLQSTNTAQIAEQRFSADMFALMFTPTDPTVQIYNSDCYVDHADGSAVEMQ